MTQNQRHEVWRLIAADPGTVAALALELLFAPALRKTIWRRGVQA